MGPTECKRARTKRPCQRASIGTAALYTDAMALSTIEDLLTDARRLYRLGDETTKLAKLDDAWQLASTLEADHPLRHAVAWKRARAHQLAGLSPLDAIEPLFSTDADPFEHYERAIVGADALARHHQDQVGYGDPRVHRIWTALAAHQKREHHLLGWAHAVLQLAWDAACTGDVDALDRHLLTVERSTVDALNIAVAHTALRAATWRGDSSRALEALEQLEHVLADQPAAEAVAEARLEAFVRFGGPSPPLTSPTSPFRVAFDAVLRGGGDPDQTMQLGRAHGPEWALAVHATAALQDRAPGDAQPLIESSGCYAFASASAP